MQIEDFQDPYSKVTVFKNEETNLKNGVDYSINETG